MKIRVWQIQTWWIFSRFCHSTSPLETLTPVEWGIRIFGFCSATTLLLFTEILKNWRLLEQQPARLNPIVIHRAIRWGVVLRLNSWFCDCLEWLTNHKPKEAPLTGLPLRSVPFAEFKSHSITEVPETSSLACQRLTSTSSNTSWLSSGPDMSTSLMTLYIISDTPDITYDTPAHTFLTTKFEILEE